MWWNIFWRKILILMDLRFHEILKKKIEENSSAQKNAFLKIVASHHGKYQQVCTVLILITHRKWHFYSIHTDAVPILKVHSRKVTQCFSGILNPNISQIFAMLAHKILEINIFSDQMFSTFLHHSCNSILGINIFSFRCHLLSFIRLLKKITVADQF